MKEGISARTFNLICHPLDVTPRALVAAIVSVEPTPPGYADFVMGAIYKATRAIPAFRCVDSWEKVHAVFAGKDDELIEEMARIVTNALEQVVKPELKKEMHEGFLKHMEILNTTTMADMKLKADASLAALSDSDAEKVLGACAGAGETVENLRKTRFPSV